MIACKSSNIARHLLVNSSFEAELRLPWSCFAFGGVVTVGVLFLLLNNYTPYGQTVKEADLETTWRFSSSTTIRRLSSADTSMSTSSSTTSTTPTASTAFTTKKALSEKMPKHVMSCVPFYDFLTDNLKKKIGLRVAPQTNLSLIAAYAYPDYSVVTIEGDGYWGKTAYCRYFDKDWHEISSPVESVVYPAFAIHCCRHPRAAYMGITLTRDGEIDHTVPVLDRTVDVLLSEKQLYAQMTLRTDPKYNLSMCLAPMYGDETKWLLLTELIEHYKLQGVQHFYLCVKDIDAYSRKLIDNYVKTGEAEAIYFREERDRPGKEWQLTGVANCVQRSRHHSRYAIFSDMDERILAFNNKTLAQYVHTRWILRTHKPPSEYDGEDTLKKHLPTLVFHNTSVVAPNGHTAKCVLDTRRVVIMWVHYPQLLFPGYIEGYADKEDAHIRHYRDQIDDNWGKTWIHEVEQMGNFTMTDYPTHLMTPLYQNVKKRLDRVYRKS
ncbi:hypothetical protein OESDEN_01011 [Oesophagostomum dentatum]|uniref:Glycosyltransferase family 92 protein n=1 Tax=Oesophagostomum dentatum TaxID=61180 RepID=A0A0B1TSA4_OESDE|nr:hypothetical protein OESDEN_01011 [Oesophagostomum dentatum]